MQISANRGATVDDALKEKVQGMLETEKIPFQRIDLDGEHVLVRFAGCRRPGQGVGCAAHAARRSYIVALNLASTVPAWLQAIGANAMPLGLDLQGGVHFLMEVDDKAVMEKQLQRYVDDIRAALRDKKIRYQSVDRGGPASWCSCAPPKIAMRR